MPACGYEFYLLVIMQLYFSLVGCAHSEISSWTLEDKISIRTRACNILYIQRILLEKQADWLIDLWRTKIIIGACKGMFSILCVHFFIAYQARITKRNPELLILNSPGGESLRKIPKTEQFVVVCSPLSMKRKISRNFYVVVVQWRQRNHTGPKSELHVQSCCFSFKPIIIAFLTF